MITFAREPSQNYTMKGACSVIYKGEMHFFGGEEFSFGLGDDGRPRFYEFRYQHFAIEARKSGRMPKMTQKEDLDIGMKFHACSTFLPLSKEIVILCFPKTTTMHFSDDMEYSACFLFDGKITYIGQTNFRHFQGTLTQYKKNLIAIGDDLESYKTEIMERQANGSFIWSEVKYDFKFPYEKLDDFFLTKIPATDFYEEYVLLTGGKIGFMDDTHVKNVFKFNGSWFDFGELKKPRGSHSSIYWNGAVYIIGGFGGFDDDKRKIEIWKIEESPDQFRSSENWPELYTWLDPHLFVVPDSFFPNY